MTANKTLFMLVGPPGSGKSTLAKSLIYDDGDHGLATVYVNQDTQGRDHLHVFDMAILDGKDVIVDRMNFNKQQRNRYLSIAKEHGYRTVITVLHQPRKVCFDRMNARTDHPTIKDPSTANSALNTFFSKYERPTQDEADEVKFVYPQGAKEETIVIDLDGTMCNVDHRLHHVRTPEGVRKNWKAFFEGLSEDTPNEWCLAIYNQFAEKYPIVFASGRPDDYGGQTKEWLKRHDLSTEHLYMRCRGDHRQDYIVKEIILDFEILTRFKPIFFIDDRKQVVDLWRSRGYTCLACAEGDF